MTDIVQRAEQALDGITGGPWLHADSSYGRCNVISTIGWNVAACSDGGIGKGDPAAVMKIAARNADFIAAAPELVRGLLEELTTKIEVLDTVLASAGRYHAERDALRANLPDLLGRAWDDGNATGLDGWIGPGRGAGEVDDEAVRARERFIRRTLDGDS